MDTKPNINDYENYLEYINDLDEYIKNKNEPLKKLALKFLNKWLKTDDKTKIIGLTNFKYKFISDLPNDDESKKFLSKYFNKYNDEFKLDFEYNEELFTTENTLYFFKHMLRKINFDLIKDKKTGKDRYSIVFKKN
jgi:hypothetical protein